MDVPEGRRAATPVVVTPGSIVLVIVALAAAVLTAEILVSARRVVSWIVASAIAAALIEFVVRALDRWMARWVAVILVLLGIAALAGVLAFGIFNDLDREVNRLQTVAPEAALRLEGSERAGTLAREIGLHERVTAAVDRIRQPSSGLAGEAVASGGAYVVSAVLTIFFLSWAPRLARSGLAQLSPERATKARRIAEKAFVHARSYVVLSIAQATFVGLVGWLACLWADLPAPVPLALALTVMALVPSFGIILGSLPILLLAGGLQSREEALTLVAVFLVLQALSIFVVQRRIVRRSLYVGPAIVVVAYLLGFELYGIGGALYCAALMVGVVAIVDASAEVTDGTEETQPEEQQQ